MDYVIIFVVVIATTAVMSAWAWSRGYKAGIRNARVNAEIRAHLARTTAKGEGIQAGTISADRIRPVTPEGPKLTDPEKDL